MFARIASLALVALGVTAMPMFDHKEIQTPKEFKAAKHIERRSIDHSAPHFVVYQDAFGTQTGPPDVGAVSGYNTFILSFLLTSGAFDKALEWQNFSADQKAQIKQSYNDAGINLMVSAFGATDHPTTAGADPVALANTMAQWVIDNNLDGIDVDYEDFDAVNAQDGRAEDWLVTFTKTLREKLPSPDYIITHAPLAPWFSTPAIYPTGAYRAVHEQAGDLIDWYNFQFYNQNEYTDCAGLIETSSTVFPETAVNQLIAYGVPAEKVVIGKPATTADATNGYVEPSLLAQCVSQAASSGWNGGVMFWQFPNATPDLIATVRGQTWPL